MRATSTFTTHAVYLLIIANCLWCTTAHAGRRSFGINDKVPEFSGVTISDQTFTYKHNQGKALMVVFLSSKNRRSTRALEDIENIISQLAADAERLEIVIIIDKPENLDLSSIQKDAPKNIHVLLDSGYKIWGKFGIIAIPTVVISDTNDKVLYIKAGHGYNFAPVVRAYTNKALGIAQKKEPQEAGRVKTIANDTTTARIKRHLQMAGILEKKGRIESAIAEIQKARELDPNSTEAALELGELFCRTSRSEAAIDLTKQLKVISQQDKARLLSLSGWANRQTGDLDTAEKHLLAAIEINPKLPRALFELGKVYQAKQQVDKAMDSYHKALTILFNE